MSKVLVVFYIKDEKKFPSLLFVDLSMMLISILSFFFIRSITSECPPDIIIKPCLCIDARSSHIYPSEIVGRQQRSIVCEHIHNSSFDLQSVFMKLNSFNDLISDDDENCTHFNRFRLYNTTFISLPENVFFNITFQSLIFEDNLQLTTIDRNAFTSFKDHVESFETLNSNLSDSETIFFIIKQFSNLRRLSLQNDRLTFIPNYAFNHTYLSHIYFGLEYPRQIQPIESIGDYAFYNLPNLYFLRIFSPMLKKINKYAFAQRKRYHSKEMLELYLGGEMLNSTSFQSTCFTRFRSRFVFLRFYYTSITYLDEQIFQPFLESNPSSLIDINSSNTLFKCTCQSAWIQLDYFKELSQLENRVYGYQCWENDFTTNCTRNK